MHRVYTCAQTKHHTTNQLKNLAQPQPGWAVFAPARARSHLLGLGINCSPHTGHSIRSKSMCRTSAGGINLPHFGQTASSDACTFLRLTSSNAARPACYRHPRSQIIRSLPRSCQRLTSPVPCTHFRSGSIVSAKQFRGRAAEKASWTWRSLGRFLSVQPLASISTIRQ